MAEKAGGETKDLPSSTRRLVVPEEQHRNINSRQPSMTTSSEQLNAAALLASGFNSNNAAGMPVTLGQSIIQALQQNGQGTIQVIIQKYQNFVFSVFYNCKNKIRTFFLFNSFFYKFWFFTKIQ